jgi:hypothetical protein
MVFQLICVFTRLALAWVFEVAIEPLESLVCHLPLLKITADTPKLWCNDLHT